MKKLITLLFFFLTGICQMQAQDILSGAWNLSNAGDEHQLFFQDGFFFYTKHQSKNFELTRGGQYKVENGKIHGTVLFNSADSTEVNQPLDLPFTISDNTLTITTPEGDAPFNRIDDGKAPLAGVWHITGRMAADGKVNPIHQTGTRQTYKLLTGSKFQWVAIDPAKKQFSGTGGGSYTFKDGKYTENIEFFSRDNSRVGAALVFDGELKDGAWHHKGLSSKGDRIYEVWGLVSKGR